VKIRQYDRRGVQKHLQSEAAGKAHCKWLALLFYLFTKINLMATKAANTNKNTSRASTRSSSNEAAQNDSRLKEFFIDELKDIYWAEKHLVKTLPKMQKAATAEELRNAFADHLEQTKTHIERLEKAFSELGEKAVAKKCDAMEGITKEGDSIIEDTEEGTATRDVGLILAAQKAEHYEISTYGGLAQLATTLGLEEVASLLHETLQEEKDTDKKLTQVAENNINYEAAEETEDEEEQ
jgi:ferritin-like metal-binding protein YciE